jgi:hypothetical protein
MAETAVRSSQSLPAVGSVPSTLALGGQRKASRVSKSEDVRGDMVLPVAGVAIAVIIAALIATSDDNNSPG